MQLLDSSRPRRTRPHAYPDQLSGGQQQRVAIARSLAMGPDVMLLDEITSALDPELVGEVLDVVRDLRANGMTMVIATHEMSFAREISDTVCFLDAGRIVESGPPTQVLGAPRPRSAPGCSSPGCSRPAVCKEASRLCQRERPLRSCPLTQSVRWSG